MENKNIILYSILMNPLRSKRYRGLNGLCRFCLEYSYDFESIRDSHHEVLKVLLLPLNLSISSEPVMCKGCAENLQKMFVFKTTSLSLKDNMMWILHNMCLFCKEGMHSLNGAFISLNSDNMDILLFKAMLEQYFPELDLQTNSNRIICKTCYESLQRRFKFIINCLGVEQKIKNYIKTASLNDKGQIELSKVALMKNVIENKERTEVIKTTNLLDNDGSSNDVRVENGNDKMVKPLLITMDEICNQQLVGDVAGQKIKPDCVAEAKAEDIYEEIDMINFNQATEIERLWADENVEVYVEDEKTGIMVNYQPVQTIGYDKVDRNAEESDIEVEGNGGTSRALERSVKKRRRKGKCGPSGGTDVDDYNGMEKKKRSFQNKDCSDQEVFSKSELDALVVRTNISGVNKFQCKLCLYTSRSKYNANRHVTLHIKP